MTWKATPKLTQDSPLFYADTIIIDEVSMLRIDVFNFIVKTLEYVNNSPQRRMRPHIQLIIVGDFFQLPPVMPFPRDGSLPISTVLSTYYGYDVGNGYAFHSMGWKKCNFTVCILKKVVRQKDAAMINALSDIRYGLRDGFTFFQGLNNSKFDKTDAIFLCGKKASAEEINRKSLNKLSSPEHIYYSKGTGNITNDDKQAPDLLTLKEGAHVILLQNTAEYQNGSSGIIVNLYKKSVDVKICATNKIVNVTYATWNAERYFFNVTTQKIEQKTVGTFSQLPLQLGYAITIHKSQGTTLDKVILSLGSSHYPEIFSYGQLYVALSRVTSAKNLQILGDFNTVPVLAAPEVLEFYKNITPFTS